MRYMSYIHKCRVYTYTNGIVCIVEGQEDVPDCTLPSPSGIEILQGVLEICYCTQCMLFVVTSMKLSPTCRVWHFIWMNQGNR